MSRRKRRAKREPVRFPWIFPAAMLVFVFGSLILGATLQVPASDRPTTVAVDGPRLPPAGESPYGGDADENAIAESDRSEPEFSSSDDLARRAERDVERIAEDASGYTLQLSVVCDPENARALAAGAEHDDRFFLLPVMLDDRACLRVCWGVYDDRETAERARDLPAELRERIDAPAPRPISGLLP